MESIYVYILLLEPFIHTIESVGLSFEMCSVFANDTIQLIYQTNVA